MIPITGPNVSSIMTSISCVTFTKTWGATYVVPSLASGKSLAASMRGLAPWAMAASTWARIREAEAREMTGPRLVVEERGSERTYCYSKE
jgi:hypothetical protein